MRGGGVGEGFDVVSWYLEIPVVSRTYCTCAFLATAGCSLDIITPYTLYFDYEKIFLQGELWRLLTNFMFFGTFSINFLFQMSFLVRYCRLLEEGDFRGRTAHFVLMLMFGVAMMTAVGTFCKVQFLGSSLTFMISYVWGRRNESIRMSFFGIVTLTAPYLPWVLLAFSLALGNDKLIIDIIGILVGHSYYFLEYVYPVIAGIRGWKWKRIMEPPTLLHWLCGTDRNDQFDLRD